MNKQQPYVVTISRQLGSGGAYLGRKLASELGISYADRDILERAATSLQVSAELIEGCDESAPSFIESVLEAFSFSVPEANYVPALPVPSYEQLRGAESDVIREIAAKQSAVIVGRGGFHWLSSHPRHLSVFLHADLGFRVRRVQELYGSTQEQALLAAQESDRARDRCLRELTRRPWTDAQQYDIALCTSTLGLMLSGRLLLEAVRARFRN
jgi:cytidylate kinase